MHCTYVSAVCADDKGEGRDGVEGDRVRVLGLAGVGGLCEKLRGHAISVSPISLIATIMRPVFESLEFSLTVPAVSVSFSSVLRSWILSLAALIGIASTFSVFCFCPVVPQCSMPCLLF